MVDSVAGYFEDHSDSKDLGRRALRGGFVSVAMQFGNGGSPDRFRGHPGPTLGAGGFWIGRDRHGSDELAPMLIDFGLGDATVQRSKITRGQVNCLFWLSSGNWLAVAVIVAASSPLIAWIYGEPRLEPIALCTAITFVLGGASNQHLALLRRSMQFGRIANIQVLSTLAGIVVAVVIAILRIWLLGAGAASDRKHVLCCRWGVVCMPMETWISRPLTVT